MTGVQTCALPISLARGLARPHRPEARPALGGLRPAQPGRVLDQQVGAGGLQLLGNYLAGRGLQRLRGGLRVAQQLVSDFAGVSLPLTQARDARLGLPHSACRQPHHPPSAAHVAQPHPTKMRRHPLLRLAKIHRNTHARKLPTTHKKSADPSAGALQRFE